MLKVAHMLSWWDKVKSDSQEYWSGWPFPSLGDLPDSGIELGSPALQADSLPSESNAYTRTFVKCSSGPYWSPHI